MTKFKSKSWVQKKGFDGAVSVWRMGLASRQSYIQTFPGSIPDRTSGVLDHFSLNKAFQQSP